MKTSERVTAGVPRDLPLDGLSPADLALVTEGALKPEREKTLMEMLMKIMMGGWIPSGNRTQWTAFMVASVAMINAVMAWGTGDVGFMDFLKAMQEQWLAF